jgi:endoglucanase
MASERNFLSEYATSDGRVIRRDQGGDIVSEGQAYGMLIAEVLGQASRARTIWSWTSRNLPGKHGLVASRATGSGQVQDTNSAADADVLLAYALLRYSGPDQDALHAAGRRMAETVLAVESVPVGGAPVLLAGPWAKSPGGSFGSVDPSYWMPSVFRAIAHYTGDRRSDAAADEALHLLAQVTQHGQRLPPDWAELSGGALRPIASPSGGAPVQYGLDAQRLPLWLATGCTSKARDLTGHWWSILSRGDAAASLALSLTGQPVNPAHHPLPLLAGAAAAAASGDGGASAALRVRAQEVAAGHPSYYGEAWLALGGALLDGVLDPCRDAGR